MSESSSLKKNKERYIKLNRVAFLQYSILFGILVLGVYGVLIASHKSFIQLGDGYKQGYFWTVELKNQIERLFAGDGISLWSWSKGVGMDTQISYFLDPFNVIAALFPVNYLELGYTVGIVLKLYCGGLAFLAFVRYIGVNVYESVVGSALYTFSGFFIAVALVHSDSLINIYMFPLLILAVERIYKGRSPVLFSIIVAYYVIGYFYCAYMGAIGACVYIVIRFFSYKDRGVKELFRTATCFFLWGIVGLCISGITLITDVIELTTASSESVTDKLSILFESEYYAEVGKKLIGAGNATGYQLAGLSLIVIMLVAVATRKISFKHTNLIMTLLCFVAILSPHLCSMFNGFGYPTLRWMFIFNFFAVWTSTEQLEDRDLVKGSNIVLCGIVLTLMTIWTIGLKSAGIIDFGERATSFIKIQLLAGAAFLAIMFVANRRDGFKRLEKMMTVMVVIIALSIAWSVALNEQKDDFKRNNAINKDLLASTQRVGSMIDDDGFYRIDQVDSCLYKHATKSPPNESLRWQTKPIYIYNSRIPSKQLEFNRLIGNNYGYSKRVYLLSNDNRTGLDYLYGVKYFLGDDKKNGVEGSDDYKGYLFDYYDNIDGVNVFKSRYEVSLGYVYGKCIKEREFLKLNRLQREQALMQAVVVPNDYNTDGLEEVKASEIETVIKDVDFEIVSTHDLKIEKDVIYAANNGASMSLKIGDVQNSQLIFSMDGLLREPTDGQSKSFILSAKNKLLKEKADNVISNQAIPGIKDYDLNMGYYNNYSDGTIKVSLSKKGNYSYENMRVSAMDAKLFDKYLKELSDNRFIINKHSDKLVEGTIDTKSSGILFLSIPLYDNWNIYIDGKKVERINDLNVCFCGARVGEGKHIITLKYNNRYFKIGGTISLMGLLLAALLYKLKR